MSMDALKLLEEDHKKFKKVMEEIDDTTERAVKTREKLLAEFRNELRAHEKIEEEIFYPALIERFKNDDIVLEGYEEHHAVDVLLDELDGVSLEDERWGAKFTVIKENVEHHIEEEEGKMWKQVRKTFDRSELEELGERMEERKRSVIAG